MADAEHFVFVVEHFAVVVEHFVVVVEHFAVAEHSVVVVVVAMAFVVKVLASDVEEMQIQIQVIQKILRMAYLDIDSLAIVDCKSTNLNLEKYFFCLLQMVFHIQLQKGIF